MARLVVTRWDECTSQIQLFTTLLTARAQQSNPRALNAELKKLTDEQKVALAKKLMQVRTQ